MFLLTSNQVELAVFKYILCTNKLLVLCIPIKKSLNKLNLTFLFLPFGSGIEIIKTTKCLRTNVISI